MESYVMSRGTKVLSLTAVLSALIFTLPGGEAFAQSAHQMPRTVTDQYLSPIHAARTLSSKRCVQALDRYLAASQTAPRVAALHDATAAWRVAFAAGEGWTSEAARFIGTEWYAENNLPLAKELLEAASTGLTGTDQHIDTLRLLGQTLLGLNELNAAKTYLHQALQACDINGVAPHNLTSPCLVLLIMIAQRERDHARIIDWTTAQLELDNRHPIAGFNEENRMQARFAIIQARADLGDKATAITQMQQLLDEHAGWGYKCGFRAYAVYQMVQWSDSLSDPLARIELVSPHLQDTDLRSSPTFATIAYELANECAKVKAWEAAAELYATSAEVSADIIELMPPDEEVDASVSVTRQTQVANQRSFHESAADSYVRAYLPERALEQIQAIMHTYEAGSPELSTLLSRYAQTLELCITDHSDERFNYPMITFID
jgi:hypothetical protein